MRTFLDTMVNKLCLIDQDLLMQIDADLRKIYTPTLHKIHMFNILSIMSQESKPVSWELLRDLIAEGKDHTSYLGTHSYPLQGRDFQRMMDVISTILTIKKGANFIGSYYMEEFIKHQEVAQKHLPQAEFHTVMQWCMEIIKDMEAQNKVAKTYMHVANYLSKHDRVESVAHAERLNEYLNGDFRVAVAPPPCGSIPVRYWTS